MNNTGNNKRTPLFFVMRYKLVWGAESQFVGLPHYHLHVLSDDSTSRCV
jgi:hypothetical protein